MSQPKPTPRPYGRRSIERPSHHLMVVLRADALDVQSAANDDGYGW